MKNILIKTLNDIGTQNFSISCKKKYTKLYEYLLEITNHLKSKYKITISQRIYHILNNIKEIPKCIECTNEVKYKNLNFGYGQFCSKYCMDNSVYLTEKKKETSILKYGVDNYAKTSESKQKYKETMLLNYGVEHFYQSYKFKTQYKKASLKKYGVDNPSKANITKEKAKKTCNERYGGDGPLCSNEVKKKYIKTIYERHGVTHNSKMLDHNEKVKQTSLKRYGVEHVMHDSKIASKSKYLRKKYIFPSGKIVYVQGYEPKALDELVKIYQENDIIVGNKNMEKEIGKIFYINENKIKRYYPDIYIKSENKIIEVKSTWTITLDPNMIKLKQQACLDLGFIYEFKIY